ncbi:unnamed protein product [Danaus chrysippus]|uniref:(African queen) hypothetical protein n=1 Tax=Danaus chrysippus TaxID=151541 RepID=A0A8J2WFG3_9NEOP|nr:unnamed protein product [Danaus chrysippus]
MHKVNSPNLLRSDVYSCTIPIDGRKARILNSGFGMHRAGRHVREPLPPRRAHDHDAPAPRPRGPASLVSTK